MDWLSYCLLCGACVLVTLYVCSTFSELSDRIENLRTEVGQQIASRVLKSDFDSERISRTRDVDLIRDRVDDLENGCFTLVRNDYDDEDEDDDDADIVTAENAEVALDYDSVNITV